MQAGDSEGAPTTPAEAKPFPRWRRITAGVLIVLSCVLAPVSVLAVWMRNQVLDTTRYVDNVAPLATNPDIQQTIATNATNRLFRAVDVKTIAEDALPDRASFLAGPLEGALRQFVYDAALRVVQSDRFAELWTDANRRAHSQLDAALTGSGGTTITIRDHAVVLDLNVVLERVRLALKERGIGIFDNIPIDNAALQFELMDAHQIENAQALVELLNKVAWVLPVLVFAFLGLGLWLSPNRRRSLLRWGIGVAVATAVLGAAIAVGRALYLDSVTSDRLPRDTAAAVFDTLVRFLRQGIRLVIAVGLVVSIAAWLSGPSSGATRLRATFKGATGKVGDHAGERGMTFGPFGDFVRMHVVAVRIAGVLLALLTLVLWHYPRATTVFWLAVLLLVYLAVVEVVARASVDTRDPTTDSPPAVDAAS